MVRPCYRMTAWSMLSAYIVFTLARHSLSRHSLSSQQGGQFTVAPLPPDVKFTAIAAAAASAFARPPANPSKIKEPTSSYSPGGLTMPAPRGGRNQITLMPLLSEKFGVASADGGNSFEYEPMGPTSRGGVRSVIVCMWWLLGAASSVLRGIGCETSQI
jgi:hypothetical protein